MIWAPRWRPWKAVSTPWDLNRERSTIVLPRPLFRSRERGEQIVDPVVAHEADHFAVVDQHHRRVGAGPQAFALLHGELAVGRRAAHRHAQLAADVGDGLLAVTQLARQVGADVDLELANRLLVVHVVER